jgi:hypothetical protein
MMRAIMVLICTFLMIGSAFGQTGIVIKATSCSPADIQKAVLLLQDNDTLSIPICKYDLMTPVIIDLGSRDNIVIKGQGSTRTIFTDKIAKGSENVPFQLIATKKFRLTGFAVISDNAVEMERWSCMIMISGSGVLGKVNNMRIRSGTCGLSAQKIGTDAFTITVDGTNLFELVDK